MSCLTRDICTLTRDCEMRPSYCKLEVNFSYDATDKEPNFLSLLHKR